MDIEKLIDDYRKAADKWEKRHPFTGTFDLRVQDALRDAATALSTLQAENEKLRAELENYRKGHCSEGGCAAEKDRDAVLAELAQVKRENDALWTHIEIVDREYRRYMDRGYIDRMDGLRRTWKRGQKED